MYEAVTNAIKYLAVFTLCKKNQESYDRDVNFLRDIEGAELKIHLSQTLSPSSFSISIIQIKQFS